MDAVVRGWGQKTKHVWTFGRFFTCTDLEYPALHNIYIYIICFCFSSNGAPQTNTETTRQRASKRTTNIL